MATVKDNLSGEWHCRYWYENTKHNNRVDTSDYTVRITCLGRDYVFHSLPNRGEAPGSQIEGRFTVDNNLVMGSWQESTSPQGEWMGMTYKGAFQLLIDAGGQRIAGLRVTTAYNNGNPKITTNRWEFTRANGAK